MAVFRLFVFLIVSSNLFAQTAIFPLSEVRTGQHGIGKTVFSGNKIEEFQVEILGVLENLGPRQSIILARLSGGPLQNTGVMQGMSGSPVYINGRLVGAVALAFNFAKEPIAGIRPIEEMRAISGTAVSKTAPEPRAALRNVPLSAATGGLGEPGGKSGGNRDAGIVQRIHVRHSGTLRARAKEDGHGAAPGDFQRRGVCRPNSAIRLSFALAT